MFSGVDVKKCKVVVITKADYKNGMTVAELKKVVSMWPEVDGNGNPTEVWIENYSDLGMSNQVKHITPLNQRISGDDMVVSADILLSP